MERAGTEDVFELLTSASREATEPQHDPKACLNGVLRGVISEFNQATGGIHIVVPSLSMLAPMMARSTVSITQVDVGREVLVVFEAGDARCPYIVGLLWEQGQNLPTQAEPIEAKVDGEQVVIEGKKRNCAQVREGEHYPHARRQSPHSRGLLA